MKIRIIFKIVQNPHQTPPNVVVLSTDPKFDPKPKNLQNYFLRNSELNFKKSFILFWVMGFWVFSFSVFSVQFSRNASHIIYVQHMSEYFLQKLHDPKMKIFQKPHDPNCHKDNSSKVMLQHGKEHAVRLLKTQHGTTKWW